MRGARSDCFEDSSSHQHNGVDRYCDTKPFLIGVAGGTASGKSTVCQKIVDSLNVDQTHHKCVEIIGQDCFYRVLSDAESVAATKGQFDFDHPDALDEVMMTSALKELKNGREVTIPAYDFITNRRSGEKIVKPADVIIFEGILAFYYKDINSLFDLKLFVDTDADTRLARRVKRDMTERNRPLENILHQYITYVKPAFEEFCLPTKKHADVIIPRGADNAVAIDLIVQHLQDLLRNGHRPAEHAVVTRSLSVLSNDSSSSFKLSDDFKYTSAH